MEKTVEKEEGREEKQQNREQRNERRNCKGVYKRGSEARKVKNLKVDMLTETFQPQTVEISGEGERRKKTK